MISPDELSRLLDVLRAAGVTELVTPELTVRMRPAPLAPLVTTAAAPAPPVERKPPGDGLPLTAAEREALFAHEGMGGFAG